MNGLNFNVYKNELVFLLLLASIFISEKAYSQETYHWIGRNGGTGPFVRDESWNNPKNWDLNRVPGVDDNVIIDFTDERVLSFVISFEELPYGSTIELNSFYFNGKVDNVDESIINFYNISLFKVNGNFELHDGFLGYVENDDEYVLFEINNILDISNSDLTGSALIKKGGDDNFLSGGNSFAIPIINESDKILRFGTNKPDNFSSSFGIDVGDPNAVIGLGPFFINRGKGSLEIGYTGDIDLPNTFIGSFGFFNGHPEGNLIIGREGGGYIIQENGGQIAISDGSSGKIEIRNLFQLDYFHPHIEIEGLEMNKFNNANITFINCVINSPLSFEYDGNLYLESNQFLSLITRFIKVGGTNDLLGGGNEFRNLSFINGSDANVIFSADGGKKDFNGFYRPSIDGDIFFCSSNFENIGAGKIEIGSEVETRFECENSFPLEPYFYFKNSLEGKISIGPEDDLGNGIIVISSGLLKFDESSSGELLLNRVYSTSELRHEFFADRIEFKNTFFEGPITASGNVILLKEENDFASNLGSEFGATAFFINGDEEIDWGGKYTFGDVAIIHNGTKRLRLLTDSEGYDFMGSVYFERKNSGEFLVAIDGVNTFAGSIVANGNFDGEIQRDVSFGSGNGIVKIVGDTPKELKGNSIITIPRMIMDSEGKLIVRAPLTITEYLTLENGIIENGENSIIIDQDASIGTGSSKSHIDGKVRIQKDGDLFFPLGNNGFYAPLRVSINAPFESPNFEARYSNTNPSDFDYNTNQKNQEIDWVSENEFWEITRIDDGETTPIISFGPGAIRSFSVEGEYGDIMTYWNGTAWVPIEAEEIAEDGTLSFVSRNNIQEFGIFSIGSSFSITPIRLLDFSADIFEDDFVKVTWSTAMEYNNDFFTLEKSTNAKSWQIISLVPSKGDSESKVEYEFLDNEIMGERHYYRLSQTDHDGRSEIFNVVSVRFTGMLGEGIAPKVFPNPTTRWLQIQLQTIHLNDGLLLLSNALGQTLQQFPIHQERNLSVDLSSYPKGVYFLRLINGRNIYTKKIILN